MKRTLSLVILFARPLHVWNIFFSVLGLSCVFRAGLIGLPFAIMIKLAGYLGVTAYQNFMDAQAYNYFRNAGHQVRKLYLRVFAADLIFFLLLTALILLTLHAHIKG